MKKKVFAVLVALLLAVSVLPAASVAAQIPAWFTLESVKALIPDNAFATATYNTICEAIENDSFSPSSMLDYTTADVLRDFSGEIIVSGSSMTSIEGINAVPNALVTINNKKIESLEPLGSVAERGEPISANGNPIHRWPDDIPDVPTSPNTYAYPTFFKSSGTAVYVDDGNPKTQTILFDVTVAGSPAWDVSNPEAAYYNTTGDVSTTAAPTDN
ncbi:MAG: hypothetical protein J6S47_08930, partial [Eubacteriaceae bacterium]|nr:hypothetical protein [Eubacteriaceae bacterium]